MALQKRYTHIGYLYKYALFYPVTNREGRPYYTRCGEKRMEIYHPRDEELLREMRRVRRSDRRRRLLWGLAILLILSVAAGLFIFHTYYELAVMHGPAMGGTLPEGALVLVKKPEANTEYVSGDIILYEKRIAEPVDITILSPKGKIRESCKYILYRDKGTTRQYYSTADGAPTWLESSTTADQFETLSDGSLRMDTENLPNGDYWLKEVWASYGQDVLKDPIPFTVVNPVRVQMKRVLAAPGESVTLGLATETRKDGRRIDTSYTSGRTADAVTEGRRVLVAKGKYFVQGDQLSLSVDSRDAEYSSVSDDEILGRAEFALWPLRCFGDLTGRSTTVADGETEAAE